ncbi:MAG: hypothetical protein ACXACA_02005 [Candidatus Ranarchaeia archaeon]
MKKKSSLILIFLLYLAFFVILGCIQIESPLNCKKNESRNACYERLAIESSDASLCDKVTPECGYPFGCHPNMCYYNVGLKTKSLLSCSEIVNDPSNYEQCYEGVAVGKQNHTMCLKLKNQTLSDHCYGEIAGSILDDDLCDKIIDQSSRNYCLQGLGIKKLNISICRKITECSPSESCTYKKAHCYASVLSSLKNFSLCEELTTERDTCYNNLAISSNNSSFCDNIKDSSLNWNCQQHFHISSD